jgi:hypothetical protein
MEPTTIKTKMTKPLHELSRAEHRATIDIGGVTHNISRRVDGFSMKCPRVDGEPGYLAGGTSPKALSPDAQVTITEERPMTVADLEVGDCFRTKGEPDYIEFLVWLGDNYIVVTNDEPPRVSKCGLMRSTQVTLVTPKFDAEPVREIETVPVGEIGIGTDFILGKQRGTMRGHHRCSECCYASWPEHDNKHLIPKSTPVTVHTDATYDSWDDVSVGDVFIREGGVACIKLSKNEWCEGGAGGGVRQANFRPIIGREFGRSVKPARLTSVSWERIPEVER